MELKDKKVVIIGAGKSGISACRLLTEEGADITLYDGNEKLDPNEVREKLGTDFAGKILIGEFPKSLEEQAELVIVSPGVPRDLPFLLRLDEADVPIWGEVELAYRFAKGKLIAVTGTNGKTTTTALTGEIMKLYFEKVFVVGNIGTPYTDFAKKMTDDSVTVAEMSSFQLESVEEFHPCVSMILNITGDDQLTLYDVSEATEYIYKQTGDDVNIIFGTVIDKSMNGVVQVTIIATDFVDSIAFKTQPVTVPENKVEVNSDFNLDTPEFMNKKAPREAVSSFSIPAFKLPQNDKE